MSGLPFSVDVHACPVYPGDRPGSLQVLYDGQTLLGHQETL